MLALLSGSAYAQEEMSEKQLEELIRKAEKMADKARKDPRFKQAMAEEIEEENRPKRFPAKDNTLFANLSPTPMTNNGLSGYLQKLYTAYKTKLPVGAVDAAQKASAALNGNADKMGIAGIAAWYNGAKSEGLLLLLQAGAKKPEDGLLLNNVSALLNIGGAPRHSLPVLRTLVQRYPENAMVLNNIGQAYAGVGELDTAMKYFGRCLKKSPQHPEANNTCGQIEKQRGHNAEAIRYFQEALKGAHHPEALEGLRELTGDSYYQKLPALRAPVDLPYFNEFKYKLPKQCSGPADAPFIKQEHEDFVNFVEKMQVAYSEAARYEQKLGDEIIEKESARIMKKVQTALQSGVPLTSPPTMGSPINLAALRKLADMGMELAAKTGPEHDRQMQKLDSNYQRLIRKYKEDQQKISDDYAEKRKQYDCGEGRGADCAALEKLAREECAAHVQLGNVAQQSISAAKVDIQNERLRFIRWELNNFSYYGYLAGFNEHSARAAFYSAATRYLNELKELAYDPFVCAGQRCDDKTFETSPKDESDNTKEMDCPIDISVPFVIGKLSLNCEKFEFTAGEGLVFTMEKNFKTKQSTMSIGAGLQFQASKQWEIFSGEISGSASQSFYIVWDKDDKIIDAGLALKAEGSIKGEAKIEMPGGIGKEYLEKEIKAEGEFGYTLGVSSGWNFNDGTLNKIAKSMGWFK